MQYYRTVTFPVAQRADAGELAYHGWLSVSDGSANGLVALFDTLFSHGRFEAELHIQLVTLGANVGQLWAADVFELAYEWFDVRVVLLCRRSGVGELYRLHMRNAERFGSQIRSPGDFYFPDLPVMAYGVNDEPLGAMHEGERQLPWNDRYLEADVRVEARRDACRQLNDLIFAAWSDGRIREPEAVCGEGVVELLYTPGSREQHVDGRTAFRSGQLEGLGAMRLGDSGAI